MLGAVVSTLTIPVIATPLSTPHSVARGHTFNPPHSVGKKAALFTPCLVYGVVTASPVVLGPDKEAFIPAKKASTSFTFKCGYSTALSRVLSLLLSCLFLP